MNSRLIPLNKCGMLMTLRQEEVLLIFRNGGMHWKSLAHIMGTILNGLKTHVVTKPGYVEIAKEIFDGTGIEISSEGKRYLGGVGRVIGLSDLLKHLADRKVQEWVDEIKKLGEIAITQPQSAYAAFTHGFWTYLLRITDPTFHSASELFQTLEDVICSSFIPALTGHCTPGNLIRNLLAFPASLGDLGLTNPVAISSEQHSASKRICAPLVGLVVTKDNQLNNQQKEIKATAHSER